MTTMARPGGVSLARLPVGRSLRRISGNRSLLVYLVFGGIAALANLLAGWLLYGTDLAPWLPYWCATAIAATVGIVVNFSLNYSFNFSFRGRSAGQQFASFFTVSAVGVVLTSAISTAIRAVLFRCLGSGLEIGNIHLSMDFTAHVTAVGLVVFYSYPAHRLISFNVGIRARLQQLKTVMVG